MACAGKHSFPGERRSSSLALSDVVHLRYTLEFSLQPVQLVCLQRMQIMCMHALVLDPLIKAVLM